MSLSFKTISLFPLITVLFSLISIAVFIIKGKKSALLLSIITLQAFIFIWALGQVFELWADDIGANRFALCLIFTGSGFIGYFWMVFCLIYTGSKYTKYAPHLFIIPMIAIIIAVTNPYHHLYFSEFSVRSYKLGILYSYFSLQCYMMVAAGVITILKFIRKQESYQKQQSIMLIMPALIPAVTSILYNFYVIIVNKNKSFVYDPTPASFVIAILILFITTYQNTIPMAMEKIISSMKVALLVINDKNRIVNFNDSFESIFKDIFNVKKNKHIVEFLTVLKDKVTPNSDSEVILASMELQLKSSAIGELNFIRSLNRSFLVNTQPIFDYKGDYQGKVISFNDITVYKVLLNEIKNKNIELSFINQQLNNHMEIVGELAVANERNRIAGEIHDTLGHTLTALIMLMKIAHLKADENVKESKDKILEGIDIAQGALKALRNYLPGILVEEDMMKYNLIEDIEKLANSSISYGIEVEYLVFEKDIYLKKLQESNSLKEFYGIHDMVYRICKEGIINALKHSNATKINIILRFAKERIKVYVIDNGQGCKEFKKGFGLSRMEERVAMFGGTINFGSDGEKGFNIYAEIPM